MLAAVPAPHGAVRGPVACAGRRLAVLGGLLVALFVALVLAGAQVALAHTDVDFTLPTDGAVVGEPVREITVGFADPVTLIGPGFELLDPQGNILTPFVVTGDNRVFRLQIDPPIGGGDAAVRYEVRAEDGHTISGGFSFTVLADTPTTTTAVPSTITTVTGSSPATAPAAVPDAVPTTVVSTVPPDTAPAASVPVASVPATAALAATDDANSSTGAYVAIAAIVVAVIAFAFLAFRSRAEAT